jgi:anti-sigma regulatory factor (Ser/Thr protein kinase)
LLRTLGEELISNEVVAVIELVKNAYDADAKHVLIRFVGPLEPGQGRIEVLDSGHGMALEIVKTVWMEPATSSKRGTVRRTEKLKRRFLGEKGIGRFASSRLADELEVVSRRNGEPKEVYALFDWRQFDDDEKFLDEVFIHWEEREPTEICKGGTIELLWQDDKSAPARKVWQGTMLRMSGLKQKWEARQFEDLRRGLARLVSPKLSKDERAEFDVELSVPDEFEQFNSKVESPTILKHPHYIVKGTVSADGKYKLTYRVLAEGTDSVKKGQFLRFKNAKGRFEFRGVVEDEDETANLETRPVECGPIEIELKIWDRDELGNVVQKTRSTIRDIRRDLDAVAGVNIFRDNFRVLPYGEPQDDWLRLDLRRVQNPTLRLSNNQIYGVVQITADDNPKLKDQSNREGLDENQALQDLREMLTSILSHLEEKRYSVRPRNEKKGKPVGGLFAGFDLKPLSDYIAREHPDDKHAKDLVEKADARFSEQLKEIQSVLARYQRLATLGPVGFGASGKARQRTTGEIDR